MATNEFLPFGTGAGANVISQADYASLVARLTGFASGVARSNEVNKAVRQAAFVAAMIGQFTADYGGDALDNGDMETFEANFKAALSAWIASEESPVDLSAYVLRAGDTMEGLFGAPAGFKTAAQLLNSATTLTTAAFGKFVEITAGSSITTTLPTPVSNGGARFTVWNNTAYSQTIATPDGAFLGPNMPGGSSTVILPGDLHTFESDGSNWIRSVYSTKNLTTFPVVSFYETAATWTRTVGARKAFIFAHAAGGAGGGSTAQNDTSSGGGAGEFRFGLFDISSISSAAVSIGAGGAGVTGGIGGTGGDTSFGSLITAKGGYGGAKNAQAGANIAKGGSGGSGGYGFPGSGGDRSRTGVSGSGGCGAFGGGGRAGDSWQGNPNGDPGYRGGGGGGSEMAAGTGGNGGDGWVLVVEI